MKSGDPDLLSLFFEDISQIPILGGLEQILPLTRRVMRANMLRGLPNHPADADIRRLLLSRDRALAKFEGLCEQVGATHLNAIVLSTEVEAFLDSPGEKAPASLAVSLSAGANLTGEARDTFLDMGWRTFYRLAALPPGLRLLPSEESPPPDTGSALRHIRREGRDAKRQVVMGTLRYAIGIARYFLGRGLDYLELVNEGVIGLMEAAGKYREWKGSHFQSYAASWIQQRIQRAIATKGCLVRVPIHAQDDLGRLGPMIDELVLRGEPNYQPAIQAKMGWKAEVARKKLRQYRTGLQPASLDSPYQYDGKAFRVEGIVSDEPDSESLAHAPLARLEIDRALVKLNPRQQRVMRLRFGLRTGVPMTLEEVGQVVGVSRERVRQIEVQSLRSLGYRAHSQPLRDCLELLEEPTRRDYVQDSELRRLSHAVSEIDIFGDTVVDELAVNDERRRIESLMDRRVPHGVKGRLYARNAAPLSFLLKSALAQLGAPTHHTKILEAAQQIAPNHPKLTRVRVYASLFYGDKHFIRHGNGVFGLAEWGASIGTSNDGRLAHCPAPLVPPAADATAFFETVLEGLEWLQKRQLSARAFWQEMAAWVGVAEADEVTAQAAFDAWYAVGLMERVHFSHNGTGPLTLQLPADLGINETRRYCIDTLCKRVDKMPELMAYLGQVMRASIADLQRALFGNAQSGYDVPNRMQLLAAFGAAQAEGPEWRLSDLGRSVLDANPPDELPDEDLIVNDSDTDPETTGADDLDLILLLS